MLLFIISTLLLFLAARFYLDLFSLKGLANRMSAMFLLFLSLMLAIFYFAGFVLGTLHPFVLAILCITVFIIAVVLCFRAKAKSESLTLALLINFKELNLAGKIALGVTTVFFFALIYLGIVLLPRFGDSVSYHIVSPIIWTQEKKFSFAGFGPPDIAPMERLWGSPRNIEIVSFWHMVFPHSLKLSNLAQVYHIVMGLFALMALARQLGLSKNLALVASSFVFFTPELFMQFTECYVDIALAMALFTIINFGFLALTDPRPGHQILFALAIGIAIGIKATTLLLIPWLILFFTVCLFIKFRLIKIVLTSWLLIGGTALLLSSCWFIHNAIKFKNPIFPYEFRLAGKVIFKGPTPANINLGFLRRDALTPFTALIKSLREDYGGPGLGAKYNGMGMPLFTLGLPAILFAIILSIKERNGLMLTYVICFLGLLLLTPDRWWPRFSFHLLGLGSLAFCFCLSRLHKSIYIIGLLLFLIGSGYNVYRTLPSIQGMAQQASFWYYLFKAADPIPLVLNQYPETYSGLNYVREKLKGKRVRLLNCGFHRSSLLMPEDLSLKIVMFKAPDYETWEAEILSQEITHIFLDRRAEHKYGNEAQWLTTHPERFKKLYSHRVVPQFTAFYKEAAGFYEVYQVLEKKRNEK